MKLRVRREALVLPHEVGESEVPVGALPLAQEDAVVEAEVLSPGQALVHVEHLGSVKR